MERYAKKPRTVDGHSLVAHTLAGLGVTHAYCVSGTPVRESFAQCAAAGIRPIGVRHQQAGVMMSLAHNYVSGRLTSVPILSAGPAVTNAATSILVAKDNCWPLVVLGGCRPLSMRGMGSFQELDAVAIYQPITKWSALVESTASLSECIQRAFQIAMAGRPGPVYLDLPEDVLSGLCDSAHVSFTTPRDPPVSAPGDDDIRRAAEILLEAARPALVIGKGVRWSAPYRELAELVDDFAIPFITSPMGRGFLPDDHPLCFNQARGLLQSRADAILLVGARLDWTFRFGSEIARSAKLIQIDIHKPAIGVNRSPTIGLVGDARIVLRRILSQMNLKRATVRKERLTPWHRVLEQTQDANRLRLESLMNADSVPLSPHRLFKEIRGALPRDAICILDGNVSMAAAQQVLPAYCPASRFTAGNNGCLGVGIPFAIGAKLAHPDRAVVALCGDTAIGFSAMEMETAVRHNIAVIIVVVNNDGNTGALTEKTYFPSSRERVTMFQPDIHYEEIMRIFGGHAEYVDHPTQVREALRRAVASGRAACINVRVDPAAPYPRD
jgi:2-hydroxyacyl-CoA lyase 1